MRLAVLAIAVAALAVTACGEPMATPTADAPPTPMATATLTPASTPSPTLPPTSTAAPASAPSPTPDPTATPRRQPTATPTLAPTATPTPLPTATPTPTAEEAAAARLSELVPWLQSPVDDAHDEAANVLIAVWLLDASLAEHHAALARIATKLPLDKLAWVATASERGDVASLASLAGLYPELAEAVLALPWGVGNASAYTDDGPAASLGELAARDPRLALEVAALPWLADDVTEHEEAALSALGELAARDLALARTVVGLPW